jgi:hypothetical protein
MTLFVYASIRNQKDVGLLSMTSFCLAISSESGNPQVTFLRLCWTSLQWAELKLEVSSSTQQEIRSPRVDITETDKEFVIKAKIPEVKNEDAKVTVDNVVLTIGGEET